ncbi:hypothetical protein QTI17_17260 [Variovorax sp. J31P179]|uniref:hypothetical protein n=1 Tax=Variovorax sp. J31P179 TaxID=3053508 RepID=UPI00257608B5|nr:hypothetical protein [Variovorax sp. J31P179]MDM0082344.1 hypothetical protein [Variovorax sp. J31P179]
MALYDEIDLSPDALAQRSAALARGATSAPPASMYDETLLAQDAAMQRRRAVLVAQAKAAAEQLGIPVPSPGTAPGWNSAVTGTHIGGRQLATPTASLLTPGIASVGNSIAQSFYDKDEANLLARERADASRRLASAPRGTPAVPETLGAYGVNIPGTPAKEPDLQDRLEFALRLKGSPMLAASADKFIEDQLVNAPTRDAQKAWERLKFGVEQDDKRATRTETARHNTVMENKPSAVAGVGMMERTGVDANGNPTYRVIPGTTPPDTYQFSSDFSQKGSRRSGTVETTGVTPKPPPTGTFHETATPDPDKSGNVIWQNPATGEQRSALPSKPPPVLKPLPSAQATAWNSNVDALGKLNKTLALLETPAGQNATGWKGFVGTLGGRLGNKLLNEYFNPDGTPTRSLIQDISSVILHDRSGAAVTLSEEQRQRFIPTIDDGPEKVKEKLTLLKEAAEFHQRTIQDFADDQGYRVPIVRDRTMGATPPPAKPAAPKGNALPTTKEGHDAAVNAAQVRVLKDNSAANRLSLSAALADRQNFIANGGVNKGSPGTNPGDTVKWGDLK